MILNIREQSQSTGTQIGLPPTANVPTLQQPPTPYDYLTLLPVLITAVTPLILGLKNKDKDKDKHDFE
ncbi:hypothetical protein NIES4071_45900 [Calothrix sp. NIES-4071]|nr:hypothetical protein NIES4071_45900 [Calothrix sp. NIES-4071]BAZ58902.1 hypothetical protein NIES4105_45830 [Calothrix sp. NIES-4105]